MRFVQLAALALVLLVLLACGTFSDDAWLSEQAPNRPDDARLTWNAVDGATYYELWKGSYPDSSLELLAQINAPLESQSFDIAPNYSILGLHTTNWKVRACNKAGCSPFTEVVTVD